MDPFNLIVILGATATGKTRVGVQVARSLGGEILSADSRQVFRGMDIGTGKDLGEYGGIPYHLIDVRNPGQEFSVFEFKKAFIETFHAIRSRGRLPILVGGTGLYLESVLLEYQLPEVPEDPALRNELSASSMAELRERLKRTKPELHNTTDLTDRSRLIRALEIAEFTLKIPAPSGGSPGIKAGCFRDPMGSPGSPPKDYPTPERKNRRRNDRGGQNASKGGPLI